MKRSVLAFFTLILFATAFYYHELILEYGSNFLSNADPGVQYYQDPSKDNYYETLLEKNE